MGGYSTQVMGRDSEGCLEEDLEDVAVRTQVTRHGGMWCVARCTLRAARATQPTMRMRQATRAALPEYSRLLGSMAAAASTSPPGPNGAAERSGRTPKATQARARHRHTGHTGREFSARGTNRQLGSCAARRGRRFRRGCARRERDPAEKPGEVQRGRARVAHVPDDPPAPHARPCRTIPRRCGCGCGSVRRTKSVRRCGAARKPSAVQST